MRKAWNVFWFRQTFSIPTKSLIRKALINKEERATESRQGFRLQDIDIIELTQTTLMAGYVNMTLLLKICVQETSSAVDLFTPAKELHVTMANSTIQGLLNTFTIEDLLPITKDKSPSFAATRLVVRLKSGRQGMISLPLNMSLKPQLEQDFLLALSDGIREILKPLGVKI